MPEERKITHRPAEAVDEEFVRELILQITAEEPGVALWPEPVRNTLLDVQYRARRRGISVQHPDAREEILLLDGVAAGWAAIARAADHFRLVEIAVRPEYRGKGIATARIRELLEEADAAGVPVRLSVIPGNPAVRLYEKLGFRTTGGEAVRIWMERPAGGAPGRGWRRPQRTINCARGRCLPKR